MHVMRFESVDADPPTLVAIRSLMDEAFEGEFTDDDWLHSLGGRHVIAQEAGAIVAHAAVTSRTIWVGDRAFDAGDVEAVATRPGRQGLGLGSAVMRATGELIVMHHEIGALSTGEHHFYERLSWERWGGPTFVRSDATLLRTSEEDDGIMVLRFGPSADVDLDASISVIARRGDDW